MKQVTTYLPFALVGVAAIGLVYFLYYKPKQDAEAAANTAAQAALTGAGNDQLLYYPPYVLPSGGTTEKKNTKAVSVKSNFLNI